MDGLDIGQLLQDLPGSGLQPALQKVGTALEKLLGEGDSDNALQDVQSATEDLTALIRKDLPTLSGVADLVDNLTKELVANPSDSAAIQGLARPVGQLLQGLFSDNLGGALQGLLGQ